TKYYVIQGRGAGGQFIFIFPSIELVVVGTAHNKGMGTMLKELPERLVPAFN
ncbi:MAG: serine hydrolase, partial [Opitutae bacterium]|nr:serine hydrolase [Opitutae bacterium]